MHIGIADNNGGKFTKDLKEHWEHSGHGVKYERGASEYIAQWADLYYVDTWDNNIHYLYKLYHGDSGVSRTDPWDNNKKPKIAVRLLDWEVWIGLARDQSMIDWVDYAICIAPHIEKKLREDNEWGDKLKVIKPGVNLDKFVSKHEPTDGFQIGMVLADMWWYKNHMGGLDIFTTLAKQDKRWRLHIRGDHEAGEFNKVMYDHYLESRGITDRVTLYSQVDDMDRWYENIDILLHPGMKEAFCYAVAEAMAKGLKVVCNNFYGAEAIWPKWILYDTHQEAVEKILAEPLKFDNRKFIEEKYNCTRQFKETDEFLAVS